MASVPMNYEINVAKKENKDDQYGRHFCKIQIPEVLEENAEEKLEFIRKVFGDDFHVSMTRWDCLGKVKENWR